MDLGTLSVQLETNLKRFSADMRKSVEVVDHSCTEIQKSVEEETKTTTELRDRFFKATHNNLQNDLYSHDQYFNNLRDKWADNESMLTQINITANAEREKILKDYANSASSMISKLQRLFRLGFLTYGINSLLDMGAAMAKAKVNGESMFRAFISGLPIINRMADSAEKFGDALADLYLMGQISATPAFNKFNEQYKETFASMKLELDLLRSGGVETAEIIESQYQQQIKDINAKKEGTKELIQYQENLNKKIKSLEGQKTANPYGTIGIRGGGANKSVEEIDKEIAALKEKQETYSTTAQKENLLLLAAQTRDEKLAALTEKQTEDTIQSQDEITNATIRMYQDLGQYPQEYFDLQEELLQKQVDAYVKAGGDIILAEQWKASEMKRIYEETLEKQENAIDQWVEHYTSIREVSEDFAKSYAAGLDDLGSKMTDWMKTGKMDWESWTNSLLTNWMDTLNKMAVAEAQKSIINPLVSSLVGAVVGGIGSGSAGSSDGAGTISQDAVYSHEFHRGGIAGKDIVPKSIVPKSFFRNAPSFHTGNEEMYAKIKKNEGVFTQEQMKNLAPANNKSTGQNQGINFSPQMKVVIVRNEQEAFEEYLNSARGEKTLLKKQAKNQKYFN